MQLQVIIAYNLGFILRSEHRLLDHIQRPDNVEFDQLHDSKLKIVAILSLVGWPAMTRTHSRSKGLLMRITKSLKAVSAAALLATSLLSLSSSASQALPAPLPVAGKSVAGVWGAGSTVGIASFLVIYDIIRRTSCSGDFLKLGGPGFGQPITPGQNVLVPRRC
ncbi:hypothetical protein E8L99_10290 [Phreatobacter aquaticus]|uniref:Uncharacterized protein n=1 Tax=Phreatobacter aquaticus TaxID=2570229 RepID=A0A4D7QPP5_9HYPH|nr:hypothetical protein [Phreatobacter aquaticus]QCK86112.1 hypothetical protein E8L99_10290 [Phreatobacter aquaticus]